MFRYAKNREVLWPVIIEVPSGDGTGQVVKAEVKIRYRLLTQTEIAERARTDLESAQQVESIDGMLAQIAPARLQERRERLIGHVLGWEGVEDEAGNTLPFTPDTINALLDVPYFYTAVELGLAEASRGAAVKNSVPGSAG
jgi:hypothetical protein